MTKNKQSILIVDDSESITECIRTFLELKEFKVDCANSYHEAVPLIEENIYNFILIDLVLSNEGMQGLQVIERCKKYQKQSDIVIITGHASLDSAIEALRNGVADYLVKPFKMEELLHRLNQLNENRTLRQELQQKKQSAIIDYLTTSLSHEINNPLTAIIGYTQLLLSEAQYLDETEKLNLLKIIETQAQRIKDVTRRLSQLRHVKLVDYIAGSQMLDLSGKKEKSEKLTSEHRTLSILIVDDDESVRSLLSDILKTHGFNILTASNGRESLAVHSRHQIDLTLLDINLPDMSSLEVLERLKQTLDHPNVMMITGVIDDTMAAQAISQGALGCIFKPFQVKEIIEIINSVLLFKEIDRL